MSFSTRYVLLVARTLPVHTGERALTSQEQSFHHDIRQKLLDTNGAITISHEFHNAAMLNSDDQALLMQKRNAFALHRLFPGGPGWAMKGGDVQWGKRVVKNIKAGSIRTPQDLDLI